MPCQDHFRFSPLTSRKIGAVGSATGGSLWLTGWTSHQ
jgi:hypothetical protein